MDFPQQPSYQLMYLPPHMESQYVFLQVSHRYNDFASLHQSLSISGVPLPLPPKKVFGNTERQFLQDRQSGLQTLLDEIAKYPLLSTSLAFRRFLDPRGYAENFYGTLV